MTDRQPHDRIEKYAVHIELRVPDYQTAVRVARELSALAVERHPGIADGWSLTPFDDWGRYIAASQQ